MISYLPFLKFSSETVQHLILIKIIYLILSKSVLDCSCMNNIILLTFEITIFLLQFHVTNKQVNNKPYFMEYFHKLYLLLKHDDDELFCGMVDRRKVFSLISSRDHCQRSSPSRISDTTRAGFEPAKSLSSGLS